MAKTKTGTKLAYKCTECGWMTAKWTGRCGECQAWGTIQETGVTPSTARTAPVTVTVDELAQPITEIDASHAESFPTGVSEFDRVLGSGLVPGAVILLAGEPGIGKSTMALDIAGQVASTRREDRKSTRLNSSHVASSYAVFCLKKKKNMSRKVHPCKDAADKQRAARAEQARPRIEAQRHSPRTRLTPKDAQNTAIVQSSNTLQL